MTEPEPAANPQADYWKGYADAIRHADIQLQCVGDDRTVRECRKIILSLVKAEYDPNHLIPEPKWPETLEGIALDGALSRPAADRGHIDACPFCGGDELNLADNEYRSRAIARLKNMAREQIVEECARVAEQFKPANVREPPTIAELEAILNDPAPGNVSINPDGTVSVDGSVAEQIAAAIRALSPAPAQTEEWRPGDPRCDECDNGLERSWVYCPFCGEPALPAPVAPPHAQEKG